MGGVYQTMLTKKSLVGVNCFYDVTRYANQWLSSAGAGFQITTLLPGHDALDLNCNWYGDVSDIDLLVNDFRDGLANFDVQVGYSHQLFSGGPDLRLSGTAYKFDDGSGVYGWRAGAELKSPDGVLSMKCETAYDPVNNSYQTVSAFFNVGFRFEHVLKGKNPFDMPERLFNSARNLARLTDRVKRHWRHTTHGVSLASNKQTITVVNKRKAPVTLYMGFIGAQGWGNYSAKDFPKFSVSSGNPNILYRTVNPGEPAVINIDPTKGKVSPAFSVDEVTWNCPQTIAEFTLYGTDGTNPRDITDISLVNGFNYPMEIASSRADVAAVQVDSATGNKNKYGVFPRYCDECNKSVKPGCPVPPDQSECSPNNQCQVWQPTGANYILSILLN
jgi:hypothetical protein